MQIKWNEVTLFTRVCSYLLLFVIFFLGFYFGGRFQDLKQITAESDNIIEKNDHTPVSEVQTLKVYQNKYLGFQITFPINWSKVQIRENKNTDSVDFLMMHNLGAYVKVFSIKRFSLDDWTNAQNSLDPTIKITESGDYVFAYILGKDDEGFVGFPDVVYGSLYHGPYDDVQTKIIPTFTFL